jgi:hypothetical protein
LILTQKGSKKKKFFEIVVCERNIAPKVIAPKVIAPKVIAPKVIGA